MGPRSLIPSGARAQARVRTVALLSCLAAAAPLVAAADAAAAASAPAIRITLLGTGGPSPVMNRFGPATLVEAGTETLLFDAGRGALLRLAAARVAWRDVDGVFFTHLHSDHVVGFPDLWLTGWLLTARATPLRAWGPSGTSAMLSRLGEAYADDIRIRVEEGGAPAGVAIEARDIAEGVVFDEGGVRVSAFLVDHKLAKPAYGYRIDHAGRSVVISGDTRYSENLIRHARGVDVLIHEVAVPASLERAGVPAGRARDVLDYHVTPRQAGEIFSKTAPRLAVYSHIVLPDASDAELIAPTRESWAGPLEIGEDLMVIDVDAAITVRRPAAQ